MHIDLNFKTELIRIKPTLTNGKYSVWAGETGNELNVLNVNPSADKFVEEIIKAYDQTATDDEVSEGSYYRGVFMRHPNGTSSDDFETNGDYMDSLVSDYDEE